ncbi:hypothetical protein C8D77_111161 [Mesorhizobium loti]|uniref:Uncharacterized protein n=1 Tax=Rhizobium loti TaxID=381 RepID=A0A8E2WAP4_RHILI|nr:hypothetical protein [Mesorhizobium loti]PWJ88438.1 hypothetical protein C8D77_111161 [Mesorhizobium loti]
MTGETQPAAEGVTEAMVGTVAENILLTVKELIKAERAHARKTGDQIDPTNTTRDEADHWHAALLDFSIEDFDAALKLVRRRIAALSLPTPGEGAPTLDTSISAETQAALDAIDDNIRAAAVQAPTTFFGSTPADPELGAVKALPWKDGETRTAFGSAYAVHQQADGLFVAVGCGSFVGGTHPTREAAQAAAQADYEARILSALVRP